MIDNEIYKNIKYANLDYIISNDVIVGYKGRDIDKDEIIEMTLKHFDLPRRSITNGMLDDTFSSIKFHDTKDIEENYNNQKAYILIQGNSLIEDENCFFEIPNGEFKELLTESVEKLNKEKRMKSIARNLHLSSNQIFVNHIIENYMKVK